jgi:putative ABC transport system permease protein
MSINEMLMSIEMGFIYGIIAVGIYLSFRVIDFPDLSCDGSFVLGAAVSAILLQKGYPPYFSLMMALLSGGLAGLATGLLYTRFKITNLLSGILVAFMLYSINLYIMGGMPNITLIEISSYSVITLLIISGIYTLLIVYLLLTDFGLALRSVGQNKTLAQNKGVNVALMTLVGLALGVPYLPNSKALQILEVV